MINVRIYARNQRNNRPVPDYPASSQCRPTTTAGEFLALIARVHGPSYPMLSDLSVDPESTIIETINQIGKLPAAEWAWLWGLPEDAPALCAKQRSAVRETWLSCEPRSVNTNYAALRFLCRVHGIELADVSSADVEQYADGCPRVMEPLVGGVGGWHGLRERSQDGIVDGMYSWRKSDGTIFSHFVTIAEIGDNGLDILDPWGVLNPEGHPDKRYTMLNNVAGCEWAAEYRLTFLEAAALGLTSRVHHVRLK